AQQRPAVGLLRCGQVVLDPRGPTRPPGGLELVARLVDPLGPPQGAAPRARPCRSVHPDSPRNHAPPTTLSLPPTAPPAPPSLGPISSRVDLSCRKSSTPAVAPRSSGHRVTEPSAWAWGVPGGPARG